MTIMKKILLLLFVATLHLTAQAQTTLLKAKSYVDVRSGKLISPANILIQGGLITTINPKTIPEGTQEINLSDKILLPGLMDMHVHLDMDMEPNYQYTLVNESGSKNTLRGAKNAEKTVLAGFTTVRSMGQAHPSHELIDVALAEASEQGWIIAPHIIPVGHMIGITGGHADLSMMGGFAEGVMDLGPEYGMVNSTDDALKATRYMIKYGAKAIKIMATAGVFSLESSVGAQQLTNEEMKTIVEEAIRHNITVAAHAHGTEGIIAAINAGVTSIEHGSLLNDEAINLMLKKGTYLVPTTGLLDQMPKSYDKMDPRIVKKAKYIIIEADKGHRKAFKAGVKVALGTDAPLIPHGQNALEFTAMVNRGMKPIDALRAATINPAAMLHLTDRGEIKTGLMADIIAVDDNPLKEVKTLEHVVFVMKAGTILKQ